MNIVFTKRDGQPVLLHYENLQFFCEKERATVSLKIADHYTGSELGFEPGTVCGYVRMISSEKIQLQFRDSEKIYEASGLFTYQTSCLPWLMALIHPGKSMI